ncbi:MAG: DUF92 domain-containing protein [Candidatus Methanospirareceae archaeon]
MFEVVFTGVVGVGALLAVIYAYTRHKIDSMALIGILIFGFLIISFFRGASYAGLIPLIAFFTLGNLATRYKYERKEALGVAEAKKGKRGIENVLGNGLSPLLFAFLYSTSNNPIYLLGFSGSVATACADTFSTEIGQADGMPRLITNLKKVPVGTNGGVTLQGLAAAILGSSLISISSLLFSFSSLWNWNSQPPSMTTFFLLSSVGGFFGCIVDSFLGATLENHKIFGIDKHGVNAIATLSGGVFAIEAFLFIGG